MHALTPGRRRLRRSLRALFLCVAVAIIGMALVIGAASLALPWVLAHPERVREYLSERLQRPVDFDHLRGVWTRTGPVFRLDRVRVGDASKGSAFEIEQAEFAVDFYAWLRKGVSFTEFRVVGVEIDATRGADGQWRVARLGKTESNDATRNAGLFDLPNISLRSARVHLVDEVRGMALDLARVDARVVNDFGTRRVGVVAWVDETAEPLRAACENAGARWSCYAGGQDVEPARWLAGVPLFGIDVVRGRADLDVWFDLDRGLDRLRVELSTEDLVLRGSRTVDIGDDESVEPRARFPLQRLALRWQRQVDGWQADWLGWNDDADDPSTRARVIKRGEGDAASYDITADEIDLAPNTVLAALSDALPEATRSALFAASARGRLSAVALRYERGDVSGTARLDQVRWRPARKTPGVDMLSGDLIAGDGAYIFQPDARMPLTVDYPHVFRKPLVTHLDRGVIGMMRTPDGWRAELSDFNLVGDGWGGHGSVAMWWDASGTRPTMDARVIVDRSLVTQAKLFWPINTMAPKVVDWLDNGLLGGTVDSGMVIVNGDLDDWPFRHNEGRFDARAHLSDLDLQYHADWPRARLDGLDVEFNGPGMAAQIDTGQVLGVRVAMAHGDIDDFHEAALDLHVEGEGAGPALVDFLRQSPIRNTAGEYLTGLSLGGDGDIDVDMYVPFKAELGESVVRGKVLLKDADLADKRWNLAFQGASGGVRFTRHGFIADDLAVTLDNEPANLTIATGEFVADDTHQLEASLRGELPVHAVLRDLPGLDAWFARMPGRSEWTVELAVNEPDEQGNSDKHLLLRSDLRGTAVELPAPLRKDADSPMPVRMSVGFPLAGSMLDVEWGELARVQARLPSPEQAFTAAITFGAANPQPLPEQGARLRGDMAALDVGGWLALTGGAGTAGWLDIDVHAEQMLLQSREFDDMRLALQASPAETRITLEGPELAGNVVLPHENERADITAEFERLHLPDAPPDSPPSTIDPSSLPVLHFWAKDLRFGKAQLGEARIETYPIANGLRFERLETDSPDLQIRARGDWTVLAGKEHSTFDITFTAESLGRMLDALGFAGIVEGGQTMARIQGGWDGSPSQFGLARIEGMLEATVGKGRILDVDPGAGRLLGLVSLQAIPRRLALDFSDFFKSGMTFDSITGRFELRAGDAYTQDLVVKGPAADIRVNGRTGIKARDYDQQLEVTPRVGGVLPVVGALAAGPAGAAAGLVVQGMFKTPLDSMVRAKYHVTGSWEKPEIVLIAKERGRARASQETPQPPTANPQEPPPPREPG